MERYSAFHPYGLFSRELGLPRSIGAENATAASLYCGMKPVGLWDSDRMSLLPSGGIFNLEFSPEGNLLVAACEKKSVQVFDPLTYKRVHSVNGAHSDCVNCVKFLDSRMFATCSDDTTIALWDIRNFRNKIATLHGHSNWIKNIEFSVKDKVLVSCGLDGSIFTWDINSHTDCSLVHRRVFHATDLMRCRLSPDAKQMIMCTTGGILIIIHNLDLAKLGDDLKGFKPNIYRLMQKSRQYMPISAFYNHLFDKRRTQNRVEFVSDFPQQNDAEVICSLQIHPQGWAALSRNISHSDKSEWTCVHDIQPDSPRDKSTTDSSADHNTTVLRCCRTPIRTRRIVRNPSSNPASLPQFVYTVEGADPNQRMSRPDDILRAAHVAGPSREEVNELDNVNDDISSRTRSQVRLRAEMYRDTEEGRSPGPSGVRIQNDVWVASLTIRQSRILQALASRGQVGRTFNMQHITGVNTGIPFTTHFTRAERARIIRNRQEPSRIDSLSQYDFNNDESADGDDYAVGKNTSLYVKHNKKRMLYYVEESNEGKGFIKELCFSADGRVICSPNNKGMRLLAFNEKCMELSHCIDESKPRKPKSLVEIGQSSGHKDLVVSARFSPRHQLLVTGCLAGQIIWYQPYSGESIM